MPVAASDGLMPGQWLEHTAYTHGDRIALIHGEKCMSYRALHEEVKTCGGRLRQQVGERVLGVDAGDPWLLSIAFFAALRFGWVLLPLQRGMPIPRRDRLLRQCGCRRILAETTPPALPKSVVWMRTQDLMQNQPVLPAAASNSEPDTVSLIVPTSGTGGEPKGVMLTTRNLAASARAASQALDLQAGDRWLDCLPLNHIGGLAILLRCLYRGATVVLHQGFDADAVWRDLIRHRITHLSLVPAMLNRLLEVSQGQAAPSALKVALVGGAALDPQLARRAHDCAWPLAVSYGMSETASFCTLERGTDAGQAAGRVGRMLDGFEIALSQQGAVRVRGDALMAGYANPQLTPGEGIEEGWFESGDLGYYDADGKLHITGRSDELLNCGGRLIHPREVELLLQACPGLSEVAVTGSRDPVWGDRLVAVYTGTISESDLESWCRQQLPGFLRPRTFVRLESLPFTPMKKLDRKALMQLIRLTKDA